MQGTLTVNFVIRLKREDPRVLLELSFGSGSHFKLNFVKSTLISFGYDYYAPARMVASQINHQIILLLKRPLTHYWTSPLNVNMDLDVMADMYLDKKGEEKYPTEMESNTILLLTFITPFIFISQRLWVCFGVCTQIWL